MTTTTTTLQTLAKEARSHFSTDKRDNGNVFWKTDGKEEWVRDLCLAAHEDGGMLPDDIRYEMIVEALNALEEYDDADDARDSIEADIYTHELTSWLASNNSRQYYCDEAANEFGLGADADTTTRLSWGQLSEKWEVFESVRQSLEDRLEELEDDDA